MDRSVTLRQWPCTRQGEKPMKTEKLQVFDFEISTSRIKGKSILFLDDPSFGRAANPVQYIPFSNENNS